MASFRLKSEDGVFRFQLCHAAFLLLSLWVTTPCPAQTQQSVGPAPAASVREINQQIRELERQQQAIEAQLRGETPPPESAQPAPTPQPTPPPAHVAEPASPSPPVSPPPPGPDALIPTASGEIYVMDQGSGPQPVPLKTDPNAIIIPPTSEPLPVPSVSPPPATATATATGRTPPSTATNVNPAIEANRRMLLIISVLCFGGAILLVAGACWLWLRPPTKSESVAEPELLEPSPILMARPEQPEPDFPVFGVDDLTKPDVDFGSPLITEEDIHAQVFSTISQVDWLIREKRLTNAVTVLQDHLARLPSNHALLVKMLELHMLMENQKAFNALAGNFRQLLTDESQEWEKVAQWGQLIDPQNPLYNERLDALIASSTTSNDDDDWAGFDNDSSPFSPITAMPSTPPTPTPPTSADPFAGIPIDEDLGPEVTFDKGLAAMRAEMEKLTAEPALSPEEGSDLWTPPPSAPSEPPLVAASSASHLQKASVGTPPPNSFVSPSPAPTAASLPPKERTLLFDPNADERTQVNMREIESRLELVRAYEDMGDFVGAKELLEEIVRTAHNKDQRAVAEEMLRDLS